MKPRSKFESAVFDANASLRATMYEQVRAELLVKTTYKPDLLLPNGLIVEMKGRHPDLRTALKKTSLLASGLRELHGQGSRSGAPAPTRTTSPTQGLQGLTKSSGPSGYTELIGTPQCPIGVALLSDKLFKMPWAKLSIKEWCIKHRILWALGPRIPDAWWSLTSHEDYARMVEEFIKERQ